MVKRWGGALILGLLFFFAMEIVEARGALAEGAAGGVGISLDQATGILQLVLGAIGTWIGVTLHSIRADQKAEAAKNSEHHSKIFEALETFNREIGYLQGNRKRRKGDD